MAYITRDFTESMERVSVPLESIRRVIAAWGDGCESDADWSGGFLLDMADGRVAYVTGWCNTSGWGCQDGADIYYYATGSLDRAQLPGPLGPDSKVGDVTWDEAPADLNLMLASASHTPSA